ncbi:MAG: SH3 domain-containing protein, partial [Clostridia bacterium]|nr:SH3 domain-containing protein [Clostridia bacterium]
MRRWIAALLTAALVFMNVPAMAELPEVRSAPLVYAKSPRNGMVRVYLSSMGAVTALDITVDGSYIADGAQDVSLTTGSKIRVALNTATGQLTLTAGGRTYAMGREMALRRRETSGTNGLRIAQAKKSGNLYPGDLHLVAQVSGGSYRLYPIVHVYMENYLCGVVPYEMGNSAQIEALKAQAVAARTYTLNKMNSRSSALYDVVDTTNDQVYYGNSDNTANCTEAVLSTKGIVLMNGSNLTSTWYTASNGGQTESAKNCWGSSGYSYLVVKDDPFDLQNSASTVKSATVYGNFNVASQSSALRSLLISKTQAALGGHAVITAVTAVTPHTPMYAAPSRLYTKMDFTLQVSVGGASRSHTVTCDIFGELESTLGLSINASKNELWSVVRQGSDFVIQSRRYGHGVGMSQRGAMRMGALGYTYDQILGFYYENSKRMRYTFTHTILSGVTNETIEYEEPPAEITDPDAVYATVTLPGVKDTTALRSYADSASPLLTYLTNGAIVEPLERGAGWTKVRYGSLIGYVRTDALAFTGEVPGSSGETVTPVTQWATVSCNGTLNLRQDAALSAKVITTIPNGEVLVVFGTKNGFARVQYGAHTGYASLDFLRLSSTYPGGQTESSGTAVTTDSVNLRAGASTAADILMVIPAGETVTVTGNDGSWCAVRVFGVSGYVQTRYLSFGGAVTPDEPDLPDTPVNGEEAVVSTTADYAMIYDQPSESSTVLGLLPRGDSVIVTYRGDLWCTVSLSGQTAYMRTQDLRFADAEGGVVTGYATVTTVSGGLNLRSRPQSGSSILIVIPRLTRVPVLAVQDGWTRVMYDGHTGWVMSSFLTMESGQAPAPPAVMAGYAKVTTPSGSLNLRQTPDAYAKVLTTIPRLTRIGILQRLNGWSQTYYAGYTGWVMDKFLTFEGEAPDTPVIPGTPSDLPETPVQPAAGYARVIGGGSLNMRQEPSSDAKVLKQIPEGMRVALLGVTGNWTKIRYGGDVGYVMSKYLAREDVNDNTGVTAQVVTPSGGLNLRDRASADAKVLAVIPRGSHMTV